ncbi:transposase [Atopobium sp. oral taxon 416]|nr:transposase [Atopobium sp. oral taxon 416]
MVPIRSLAYVGMDPTKSESGKSVASGKSMSKCAAADLRWALMQATDCVRRYDP